MIMMMIHSNSFGSNLSAEELGIKKKKLTIAWSSHSIEREFESSMWSLAFGFNNNLIIYLNIFPSLFWKGLLKELWQKYLPRPFNLEDKKNINNNSSLVVRFSLLLLILVCVCVCVSVLVPLAFWLWWWFRGYKNEDDDAINVKGCHYSLKIRSFYSPPFNPQASFSNCFLDVLIQH